MRKLIGSAGICAAMLLAQHSQQAQQASPQQAPPAPGQAQNNGAPPPKADFSTSLHLVVEDVSVKDKQGKIIEGLKAQDFVITEDGKPQTISFCEFQQLPSEPAGRPARHCFDATTTRSLP